MLLWLAVWLSTAASVSQAAPMTAPTRLAFTIQEYEKLSPFDGIRWPGPRAEVKIGDAWYGWKSVAGIDSVELVQFCEKTWPDKGIKRIEEDLVEALDLKGIKLERTVDLELIDLATGEVILMEDVVMTRAQRDAIRDASHRKAYRFVVESGTPMDSTKRIERSHRLVMKAEFAVLARWPNLNGPELSAEQIRQDLGQLEWLIQERFAYRDLLQIDYRGALDAVRVSIPERPTVPAFAAQIQKVLALFGDGHSRVRSRWVLRGYAPFLTHWIGGKLLAFRADRSGLLDEAFPVLEGIDGLPLEKWLEASDRVICDSSPQFAKERIARGLRDIVYLRTELGLPAKRRIKLMLRSLNSKEHKQLIVPVVEQKPIFGSWPEMESQILKEEIGYLRIPSMSSKREFLADLDRRMREFRTTDGLVIDLRGNGGGSRDALRTLLPYFLADGEAAVVNLARYRLEQGQDPHFENGYMENRGLYPAAWGGWSQAQRQAIERIRGSFQGDWNPVEEEFSDWHYFVIEQSTNPKAYPYTKPVVLLMNESCFSATDIFLGAFAGRPGVTLIGRPSGGGSGRSLGYTLDHSGVEIRLSSMASFRPTGARYDGLGIEVDQWVPASVGEFLGTDDVTLEKAIQTIRKSK